WTGAALACGIMGFPLMVRAIRLAIESVDARLEEAAGTLGANRVWVFATITLPLIIPGILTGMILCFAKAMGEFGATITFVSNIPGETQTLPSAIYTLTQVPGGDEGALRLTLVSVAISMLALLVSEVMARFANRRLEIECRSPSTSDTGSEASSSMPNSRRGGGWSRYLDGRDPARLRSSTSSPGSSGPTTAVS